ncbi:hypothetical protein Syun_001342 [Stephania yunnanensis]|uniref:Uncharacterized protein n=1 Tax=Stephania yunnanensis TaxID=152371 RepID=A0AAP0LFC2_9MAGN
MDRYIRVMKYAEGAADTDTDQAYYVMHGFLDFIAPSTIQEAYERAMVSESFGSTWTGVPVASSTSSQSVRGCRDDQRKKKVRRSWLRVTLVHYNSQHRRILNISTIKGLMVEAVARDRVGVRIKYKDRDISLVRHSDRDRDNMFHLDKDFIEVIVGCRVRISRRERDVLKRSHYSKCSVGFQKKASLRRKALTKEYLLLYVTIFGARAPTGAISKFLDQQSLRV